MSLQDLRAQLTRLKARAERRDAPTLDQYLVATRSETARRLRGVYESLACIPSLDGSPTPHPGRDRELLADDNSEKAEEDRRVVGAWEGAHGTPDIKGAADEARAKLLATRPRWTCAR